MSPDVGVDSFRAVIGVMPAVVGVTPTGVSVVLVEAVDPVNHPPALPSLFKDCGAGGARYDLRL